MPLLPFQQTILTELTQATQPPQSDALLIIARGLGLRDMICTLLKIYDDKTNLVLLLNATEEEERGIGETIGMKLKAIGYEMPAKERQAAYAAGGILSVTSRIVIVDMLNKVIPMELITGLVIMHAETVTPTSSEAFIVRVYREANKTGFLKAFSDQPEQFHFGLSPLQTVMTQLKIRNVMIWPRFHVDVQKALEKRRADVQELHQPLSPLMDQIQIAILECLEASLNEIKKSHIFADSEDMTVDNALFKAFDKTLNSQLAPQMHKVGPKTKQLVNDIYDLRKLLQSLITMDCVAFNQFLETTVNSSSISTVTGNAKQHQSPWLFLQAADVMIQAARHRVYVKAESQDPALQNGQAASMWEPSAEEEEALFSLDLEPEAELFAPVNGHAKKEDWWKKLKIEPVLEEQPKWSLLCEILDEIEQDLHFADHDPNSQTTDTILIMCSSSYTCTTLRHYLTEEPDEDGHRNGRGLLDRRLRSYFHWKKAMGKMAHNIKNKGKPKDDVQLEPESAALKRKREYKKGQPSYKRRRVRGGGTNGAEAQPRSTSRSDEAPQPDILPENAQLPPVADRTDLEADQDAMAMTLDDADQFEDYFGLCSPTDLVVIRPYQGDEDNKILEELRPKYIIMYEPDTAFVRRVECYRSSHFGMAMRVYFMIYGGSTEEQKYLASIRREKDSFERIIKERANMALTLEAERRPGEREEELLRTVSSRIAGGGRLAISEPPKILVDIREFRSSLPSLLHAAAFHVEPLTLGIGDYILSPLICIERKSIPDLIQSFNSGRLYQQCELMMIHYKQPTLLIEFDESKSFSLQTYSNSKAATNAYSSDTDLYAKLVLLTLTFPRLRTIWSPSPYFTAEVFSELKQNQEEPDADRAILVGTDSENGEPAGDLESPFLHAPQDLLRSMPGVTSKNYRYIMSKVHNLEELANMEQLALAELIGNEAARLLYNFLNESSFEDS